MTTLQELADAAHPACDDDWGSERQIEAENRFFDAVRERLTPEAFEALESYCHKATTEEMIAEGLRLCALS